MRRFLLSSKFHCQYLSSSSCSVLFGFPHVALFKPVVVVTHPSLRSALLPSTRSDKRGKETRAQHLQGAPVEVRTEKVLWDMLDTLRHLPKLNLLNFNQFL